MSMHRNIKILLTCSVLLHSGVNLLAPIYAMFIKKIGGNLLDAGIAVGIYAILKGIFYFLTGRIKEEIIPKKYMIVIGYFLFSVSYFFYIGASRPSHVFYIQIVLAIGETIVNPAWSAVIAMSLEKGKERGIYSNFYGYRSIFEGIAAISGGLFAIKLGFNVVFIFMGLFALTASIFSFFLVELENKSQ